MAHVQEVIPKAPSDHEPDKGVEAAVAECVSAEDARRDRKYVRRLDIFML